MKTIRNVSVALLLVTARFAEAQTVPLKGGSDGSDGPLVLQNDEDRELALPPDGVFNFTTIHIGDSANLRFKKNALNTPVYLLATGDIVIDGDVHVTPPGIGTGVSDRIGGPGGFDGGLGGLGELLPGPGFGPGGGQPKHQVDGAAKAGSGNFSPEIDDASDPLTGGKPYGNRILIPLIGGSGGAGYTPESPASTDEGAGGGGGGAILLASATRILILQGSRVFAHGIGDYDDRFAGDGSGGAIRLVAPIVEGEGTLSVHGNGAAGRGRIRIDSIVRENMNLRFGRSDFSSFVSFGANLVVFPDVVPQLRVLEAAGRLIPENSNVPVSVTLAPGAPEQQTVRVRASDFEADVKIAVVLTPNTGERRIFEATINNRNQNPAEVTVPVNVIANVRTFIHVWTVAE